MSSHGREEELRKRLRLIHLLHQTNPYPTGPGTANQRRQRRRRWRKRWQQLLALADRIYSFPDPPTDTPLDLAIQILQPILQRLSATLRRIREVLRTELTYLQYGWSYFQEAVQAGWRSATETLAGAWGDLWETLRRGGRWILAIPRRIRQGLELTLL
uniref:Protein Rev n=1 Tax=Simian immunodeficiency virus TaxID=11723 RepID=M4J0K6_SIV|nr:rev protein [Simian immunodeficiency virus]